MENMKCKMVMNQNFKIKIITRNEVGFSFVIIEPKNIFKFFKTKTN